eukprot:gene19300-biopygen21388
MRSAAEKIRNKAGLREVPRERLSSRSECDPWDAEWARKATFYTEMCIPICRTDPAGIKRAAAQMTVHKRGKKNGFDLEAWTDGSAKSGYRSGGAGVLLLERKHAVKLPQGDLLSSTRGYQTTELCEAAGRWCSSFRAELHGIRMALREIALRDVTNKRILVCCDSRSAIQRLQRGPCDQRGYLEEDIWPKIRIVCESDHAPAEIVFQWVSSHCGLGRNDVCDFLTGAGSGLAQQEVPIDLSTVKALLSRYAKDELRGMVQAGGPDVTSSTLQWPRFRKRSQAQAQTKRKRSQAQAHQAQAQAQAQ